MLAVSVGLSEDELEVLGFAACPALQAAVEAALARNAHVAIGLLPHGGDCLPIFVSFLDYYPSSLTKLDYYA